jgi:UDP:flavonoid glycosyltransferase YjiC (YdhE family)
MLLAGGYGDVLGLAGRIGGWATLLQVTQAEVMVANHAPTAVLAARALDTPVVITCIGFELPPAVEPLPSIRPWEVSATSELLRADADALRSINAVLHKYSKAPLRRVADLFAGLPALLTTFPELDHYDHRSEGQYVGTLPSLPNGTEAKWPNSEGRKIFCYLRPSVPGFDHLLMALRHTNASVLCVAPGMPEDAIPRFTSDKMTVLTTPIALERTLPHADLAVVYGTGTMVDALLAGVPLIMVPQVVEQALAAHRIEQLRAGVLWRGPKTVEGAKNIVRTALECEEISTNAKHFALRHKKHSPRKTIESIAKEIAKHL